MKCRVAGCKGDRVLSMGHTSEFCRLHDTKWGSSPEHLRWWKCANDEDAVRNTALADFCRRVEAEERRDRETAR